jgi:hypothetical protein
VPLKRLDPPSLGYGAAGTAGRLQHALQLSA